jgi:hypothetical protein
MNTTEFKRPLGPGPYPAVQNPQGVPPVSTERLLNLVDLLDQLMTFTSGPAWHRARAEREQLQAEIDRRKRLAR